MNESPSVTSPAASIHRVRAVLALIIVAGTVLVFTGTLKSSFTGWDDEVYVYKNPRIRTLNSESITWFFTHSFFASYTPFALISHAVDYHVWGNDPRGHHLTSILLHGANTVWLYLLALLIFPLVLGRKGGGEPEAYAAAIAALMFAVHPLRVESIASVADRKDLLCAFFLLPSLISYVAYSRDRGSNKRKRWYFFALGSFLVALLSKSIAITLPFLLLLLDLIIIRPGAPRTTGMALLKEKVPFFVLSFAVGIIAMLTAPLSVESAPLGHLSSFEKLLLPWYNAAFYPAKTVWPRDLSILYEYDPVTFVVLAATGIVVTVALLILLFRRWRLLPSVWVGYALLLLPTSGIILSGIQPTADRYAYIPTTVFFLAAGVLLLRAWGSPGPPGRIVLARASLVVVVACLIALLIVLTMKQIGYWSNAETLWRHAQSVAPGRPEPWYNLGIASQDRGDFDGATENYIKALKIRPEYPEVFVNLGNIHRAKGDTTRAISSYERAIELQPAYVLAYNDLAGLQLAAGNADEAIASYKQSLSIDPQGSAALYGLGLAYRAKGDTAEAVAVLQKLISMNPAHAQAIVAIGMILLERGDREGAVEYLRQAARLNHQEAQRILTERNIDW
jgi:Flp pilus assembly protein TadD